MQENFGGIIMKLEPYRVESRRVNTPDGKKKKGWFVTVSIRNWYDSYIIHWYSSLVLYRVWPYTNYNIEKNNPDVGHIQYVVKSIATCKIKSLYNQPKPYLYII
jgi:hypothetical protein